MGKLHCSQFYYYPFCEQLVQCNIRAKHASNIIRDDSLFQIIRSTNTTWILRYSHTALVIIYFSTHLDICKSYFTNEIGILHQQMVILILITLFYLHNKKLNSNGNVTSRPLLGLLSILAIIVLKAQQHTETSCQISSQASCELWWI